MGWQLANQHVLLSAKVNSGMPGMPPVSTQQPGLLEDRELDEFCVCPALAFCSLVSYPATTQASCSRCHLLSAFQLKPCVSPSKAAPALHPGQAKAAPRLLSDSLSLSLNYCSFVEV